MKNRTIAIIDDHPLVRAGLVQLIEEDSGAKVVGEADDADSGYEMLKKIQPDMAIVDISLPGMSGLELTSKITKNLTDIKVLVLSMHKESLYAERALKAGARGFVMKATAADTVQEAIRQVFSGKIYLSEEMKDRIVSRVASGSIDDGEVSPLSKLTPREMEVFQMIGAGTKTGEIAKTMNLSRKTIDTHCANIKAKMKFKNSTELTEYAVLWVNDN